MPLLRVGPVAVPTPGEVLDACGAVTEWAGEVVDVGARLPARVDGLLTEVTRLVGVLGDVADRVDALLHRADAIVGRIDGVLDDARATTAGADELVAAARLITDGAGEVIDGARRATAGADEVVAASRTLTDGAAEVMRSAGAASASATEMLELYRPLLERGAPLAGRFVDDLTPEEVDAAIKLVDQLPRLTEHMVTDILPILETLDRVGPDISELLGVTKDLRQAFAGVPGLSYLTRRGAAKEGAGDDG